MNKACHKISFLIFDCIINVSLNSLELKSILQKMYGAMELSQTDKTAHLEYVIDSADEKYKNIKILRLGAAEMVAADLGEFIFMFEKDMTIELQKNRSDLLFIHSAALEYKGQGLLIVAPSGTGKSTTSWAMINSGFNYLSDELAPIDLRAMKVLSYPHALCLKAVPPLFDLPVETLYTSRTIHVPSNLCFNLAVPSMVELKYIFFLEYDKTISSPNIIAVTDAEASAKLYANSLNVLAHDVGDAGIQSVVLMAKNTKSYRLESNHLDKTCASIKLLMDKNRI